MTDCTDVIFALERIANTLRTMLMAMGVLTGFVAYHVLRRR
jgi:hypothetical protein